MIASLVADSSAAVTSFGAPSFEYKALSPILIVLAAAVIGVLIEAFAPREVRWTVQIILTIGALAAALIMVIALAGTRTTAAVGAVVIDGPALVLQGTILALALMAMLTFAERQVDHGLDAFAPRASALPGSADERTLTKMGTLQTEVFPLALFSIAGMLLFPASNDLLTMFVALEVLSLPLYLLCGMARRRRLLSQEASVKYFLLGAFSSAFFLYGIALVYGYANSVSLPAIAAAASSNTGTNNILIIVGVALIAIGLLFKIGAAPFHQWTPDVYVGAPTPVTGFMAACTKVAAFGALLRVFYVSFGGLRWDWRPLMWTVAILTMLVGVILALTQSDIKRMLAYSSIAQAGFILVGVVAVSPAGTSSVLFYLIAYGFATIGAFAVVTLVRDPSGEATHLSQWAGLGKRAPWIAAIFALFMLTHGRHPVDGRIHR